MTEITSIWTVKSMDCYFEVANQQNVVSTIGWQLSAKDGAYSAAIHGLVNIPFDPDAPFTPYVNLTSAQVIGWVHDVLGQTQVDAYELSIANAIDAQKSPTIITPPLPWVVKP